MSEPPKGCLRRFQLGFAIAALGFFSLIFFSKRVFFPQVCFQKTCLGVELALTAKQREHGLMFRRHLPDNQGMLFVFPNDDYWVFWMKNTYIPLDIVWLDSHHKVVDMVLNARPMALESPPAFKPAFRAQYVLEGNAGFVEKNKIQTGDQARIRWIFLPKKI